MTALAATGWLLALTAALYALALRRRLELVACADHELRGPLTALGLAVSAWERDPALASAAAVLEAQLARARAGLRDLAAAREGRRAAARPEQLRLDALAYAASAGWAHGRRAVRLDWQAGAATMHADRGRVAQVLGNLIANAVEHGSGDVRVRARRRGGSIRVELVNQRGAEAGARRRPGRGRGLEIAACAASDSGGALSFNADGDLAVATLDLPVEA